MGVNEIRGVLGALSAARDLVPQPRPPVARATSPAPSPGGLAKAYITVEGGERLEGWFNPNKYRISRANSWSESPVVGKNLPQLQFGGGQSRKMSLELVFDDSERPNGDVRDITSALFAAMDVRDGLDPSKNAARPPTVDFGWGATRTFTAVIEQLSIEFVLFRPDGVPVRATAQIELRQADDVVGATPGSMGGVAGASGAGAGGGAALGPHTVRAGDSLQSIAGDALGDPTRWREIAESNGIDNPMNLIAGTVLTIPRGARAAIDSAGQIGGRAEALVTTARALRDQARSLPGGRG
jgi:hypothetical protein